MPTHFRAILVLLTPLLLWSCSSPAAEPVAGTAVASGDSVDQGADLLTPTLLPSRPTVLEDLESQVSCAGKVNLRWERNGVPLAGQIGSRLPAGLAVRGDLVAVVAYSREGEVRAQVAIANSQPQVRQVRLAEPRVAGGEALRVEVEGVDPDGDALGYRYQWLVNEKELYWERGPELAGDKFRRGDKVALRVTPNDGQDDGQVFQGLELTIPNAPPKFVSTPPKSLQGQTYQYQVQVEDPDGDSVDYALETGPKGMQIDPASGLLSWTYSRGDSGTHPIRIVAKDPQGLGAYQEYSLGLTVPQSQGTP